MTLVDDEDSKSRDACYTLISLVKPSSIHRVLKDEQAIWNLLVTVH